MTHAHTQSACACLGVAGFRHGRPGRLEALHGVGTPAKLGRQSAQRTTQRSTSKHSAAQRGGAQRKTAHPGRHMPSHTHLRITAEKRSHSRVVVVTQTCDGAMLFA